MNLQENVKKIRQALNLKTPSSKKMQHTITQTHFFPFPTREPERVKFKNNFYPIVGGFSRFVCRKQSIDMENPTEFIQMVLDKTALSIEEKDKPALASILEQYLFGPNNQLRVFSPYMFLLQPYTNNGEAKGEKRIASFLYDVFGRDFHDLQRFLEKKQKVNLLATMITEQLDGLKESEEKENMYLDKLPFIKPLFQDDVRFLMQKEESFMEHYPMLVAYYYFFYITQLTIKVSNFEENNYSEPSDVYYLIEGESAHKSRKSYTDGFTRVKELSAKLYVHMITLDHLNYLLDVPGDFTYQQLQQKFDSLQEEQQKECIQALKQWMMDYLEMKEFKDYTFSSDNFAGLMREYYKLMDYSIGKTGTVSRFSLSIQEIGKKYFLKARGSLGYMLYLTQDLLLLLTAVCIKNEKMSLNQLFEEYAKRGLFFDRYSKEEIIQLFNALNLIDKKSDSGDAQYVKPIL